MVLGSAEPPSLTVAASEELPDVFEAPEEPSDSAVPPSSVQGSIATADSEPAEQARQPPARTVQFDESVESIAAVAVSDDEDDDEEDVFAGVLNCSGKARLCTTTCSPMLHRWSFAASRVRAER